MSPDDRAAIDEEFFWNLRNTPRAVPQKQFEPGQEGYGPELCKNEDCEAPIPELSRRRGHKFCTECRAQAERLEKRGY